MQSITGPRVKGNLQSFSNGFGAVNNMHVAYTVRFSAGDHRHGFGFRVKAEDNLHVLS